jgi:murein peptide amidase A
MSLLQTFILGHSATGLPLLAYRFGGQGAKILILGGVHGNEPEGVVLATSLIDAFSREFGFQLQITIVPMLNPDGVLSSTRLNSRGIDLNRNLPTKDWTAEIANPRYPPGPYANSEPENQALVRWLTDHQPRIVFNLHSWHPMLNVNGDCEPEAQTLHRWLGYSIVKDIGYPTPGSLGTYCGLERNMPTLTYEIERGLASSMVIQKHKPALIEALKVSQERFRT